MTENKDDILARIDAQSAKIDAMYNALMVTQPGQSKSLLERMATVTVAIEGGQSTGRILIWIAGVLAAVGSVYIALHSNQH